MVGAEARRQESSLKYSIIRFPAAAESGGYISGVGVGRDPLDEDMEAFLQIWEPILVGRRKSGDQ